MALDAEAALPLKREVSFLLNQADVASPRGLFLALAPTRYIASYAVMLKSFTILLVLLLAACALSTSLPVERASSSEHEVALRLVQYTEVLRRQDAQALSAMFEPAGSMGHQGQPVINGRSAIQAFLESFASYKVVSHEMRVLSASAQGGVVRQTGTYAQTVRTPAGQVLHVTGTFTAVWRHQPNGQWLIESMRTAPPNGG